MTNATIDAIVAGGVPVPTILEDLGERDDECKQYAHACAEKLITVAQGGHRFQHTIYEAIGSS